MKRFLISTIIVLMVIPSVFAQKKIKGNGKVVTKDVSTSDYDRIFVQGPFEVILTEGEEGNITIKGESNIIPNIKMEVNKGTLKISNNSKVSLYSKKDIVIRVPVQDVNAISLEGSGDITSEKDIKASELEVNLMGSGDISLNVEVTRLRSSVTGSGDVQIKGNTNYLRAKVKGSGDFHGKSLEANVTEVVVKGSGDASVVANEFINAYVDGSGDIVYSGNPQREQIEISGSGDITKK